jgi:hypothetical protein
LVDYKELFGAVSVALAVTGCSARVERPILDRFFAASRLRDTTQLSSIATVIYEPRIQGLVTSYEISAVSPDRAAAANAIARDVTIAAHVVLPDHQSTTRTLVVTLTRTTPNGDWIVTTVR